MFGSYGDGDEGLEGLLSMLNGGKPRFEPSEWQALQERSLKGEVVSKLVVAKDASRGEWVVRETDPVAVSARESVWMPVEWAVEDLDSSATADEAVEQQRMLFLDGGWPEGSFTVEAAQ